MSAFKRLVKKHFRDKGRVLPWRIKATPYHILVSEVMLQQTQVERVLPYYARFIKRYPTIRALARSPLAEVLREWQGLGYNRRGKFLHDAAKAIVERHGGTLPRERDALEALPGIGRYTAGAIRAFAWNEKEIFLETNIRTVFIHHFFPHLPKVRDAALLDLVAEAIRRESSPREWYYALMDYGSFLKKNGVQLNGRSAHYKKQTRFEGSDRQLRGKILKFALSSKKSLSQKEITRQLKGVPRGKVREQYHALRREGLI